MAMLLLSSVAAYRTFIEKNQLVSVVNDLVNGLNFARLSAMTSQSTITVCARSRTNQCGSQWSQGQLIINDSQHRLIQQYKALPKTYQLIWRSSLGQSDVLRFRPNGFTNGQQGSFLICPRLNSHAMSARIVILRTGRVRSEIGEVAQCDEKQE